MILNQGFPDVRVCQEADALTESGYEVWIVVSSLETRSPEFDAKHFNTIVIDTSLEAKRALADKLNFLMYKFSVIETRVFKHPMFSSIKNRIIAVHVHDLHWCRFGYAIAKKLDVSFVADFHENSPAIPEYLQKKIITKSPKQTLFNFFSYSRYVLSVYEKWVQRTADAIIVVTKENGDRLKKQIKSKQKIYCVSNTKNPTKYSYIGINDEPEITLFYHGTIQPNRGIDVLAKAFSRLDPNKYRLTILGFSHDRKQKDMIEHLLSSEHLKKTRLLDWTSDFNIILSEATKADIGFIPHNRCELTETTLPNKLFEYFCYGKPVVVSDVAPLKRIVEDANAGLAFEAGNDLDLANCIIKMGDKKTLKTLSVRARKAAEGKYSWNSDKAELLKLYTEMLG